VPCELHLVKRNSSICASTAVTLVLFPFWPSSVYLSLLDESEVIGCFFRYSLLIQDDRLLGHPGTAPAALFLSCPALRFETGSGSCTACTYLPAYIQLHTPPPES